MQTDSDQAAVVASDSSLPVTFFSGRGLLLTVAFGLLWLVLINELRVDWQVNAQYSYGWVVPVLCLGLLLRRWSDYRPVSDAPPPTSRLVLLFIACALLLLPLRMGLEAIPGWRSLNWVLAGVVLALTMMGTYWLLGNLGARHYAFPICFILVAVPWPFSLEVPLIQGLTRANVATTIELLGWLGIPATQHGNLIEVGTGVVGVDEACSGIRSFQSSIMISLFFGEFYRLSLWRRLTLVPIGFLVSFGFNVCRTAILTWLAAKNGTGAIAQYHDQAGFTILLACSVALWAIAWFFHYRSQKKLTTRTPADGRKTEAENAQFKVKGTAEKLTPLAIPRSSRISRLVFVSLLVWLLVVEAGVELWYRAHEDRASNQPEWALSWPPQEAGFRELAVPEIAREMLQYDEGHSGAWISGDGGDWQMFYFRWLPGRLSVSSARSHNPNICLAAAGKELRQLTDSRCPITIGNVVFPFTRYEYEQDGRVMHVFHCLWEEHAPGRYFDFDDQSGELKRRLQAVWHGQRNLGQRAIQVIVADLGDSRPVPAAVQAQLTKLVRVSRDPAAR